jgi:hypothetical protein
VRLVAARLANRRRKPEGVSIGRLIRKQVQEKAKRQNVAVRESTKRSLRAFGPDGGHVKPLKSPAEIFPRPVVVERKFQRLAEEFPRESGLDLEIVEFPTGIEGAGIGVVTGPDIEVPFAAA